MVESIFQSAHRLLNTLNMILEYSQCESDKIEIVKSLFNPNEVILELCKSYENLITKKNIYLNFETAKRELVCYSDKAIFKTIINHLLNNAIKFTFKGGVTISLDIIEENNSKELRIRIKDTGIGIKKELQNIIFEEFKQISEGINRTFEGCGLGLTIAKKFTEKLKGKINFQSSENSGTTFIVQIPFLEKEEWFNNNQETGELVAEISELPKSELKKILYIEDDINSQNLISLYLKNEYNLDFASTAIEGIEKAKENDYSAILMDINLGRGIDGLKATKIIKSFEKCKDIPIIAITAYFMDFDKKDIINAGCNYLLTKPINRDKLISVLKEVFKQIDSKS